MRSRHQTSSSLPSTDQVEAARYTDLSRGQWARLRDSTPLPISEAQLQPLGGLTESVSVDEVIDVYLPLSRLINLYASATRRLRESTTRFLGRETAHAPYVIGIAGSVAVGKSTASRVLRALLSHWPDHPRVDLITTDGFLLPNAILQREGLMEKKGFPQSYDLSALLSFLTDIKAGRSIDQAIAWHNDVPQGLSSAIFTRDLLEDRVVEARSVRFGECLARELQHHA